MFEHRARRAARLAVRPLLALDEVLNERHDVARVHLAGVVRHRRREVGRSEDGDAVDDHGLVRLASARSCRRVSAARSTMTDPGGIASTISAVTRIGALLAGNRGGRDDDVGRGDGLHHHLALPAVERFVLRLRVPACVLRVAGFDRHLDEPGAEALNLFLDRRPDVVRLDARAQPSCASRWPEAPRRRRRRRTPARPRRCRRPC